jgi:hypothetical protein
VDAGKLPTISPNRGVHSTPDATGPQTGGLPALLSNASFDDNDINACAYRIATPLQLSYCEPLAYDSEIGKAMLKNRERRAMIRRKVRDHEIELLLDVMFGWRFVKGQRVLQEARFARIRQILGDVMGHPLKDPCCEWADLTKYLQTLREKLTKYARWMMLQGKAKFFCRWQIVWAGCCDTRQVRVLGLRREDYSKPRMNRETMDKFFSTNRGRNYLVSLGNATADAFVAACRQECIDLETLGEYTAEQLERCNIASHLASGLYNKVQAMLRPTYFRIEVVLQDNPTTQMFLAQLEPLIEEFREMRKKGEHPLGASSQQLVEENHMRKMQQEAEEKETAALEALNPGVAYNQIRVDTRCKISPTSVELIRTSQVAGTDMPEDPDWARGYVLEFPDRMVGELDLHEVWVDLVLPEGASAFVFVADRSNPTGKPLHRSNLVKGMGMDEQQYRFDMNQKRTCEISCNHAVMVHITARHVPSKYLYWNAHTLIQSVRQLNSILTIRPVECPKSLVMTDSKKQLSIQFVFGRVTGQEELDPSSKHRAARSPLTPSFSQRGAETPLTPQTGETGGRSRPETGRLGTADRMIRRWERVTVATGHDDLQELHEARKMLQTSKSVRFINTEDETGACGASGREGGVFKNDSKLNERKRGGKKTALSRKRQFHGTRDMRKDMTMQLQATFACCFNPKYNEFWVNFDFPSPVITCMDFNGKATHRVNHSQGFSPNCMTMDTLGNLYASDGAFSFFKFGHERYWDMPYNVWAHRMTRLWEFREIHFKRLNTHESSFACGVAIDATNEDILYAAFSKGPIIMIHTKKAENIGRIDPDPPFQCVSSMCCCSNALVVGDSHQIKIFDLQGNQVSVLGQLYNDPCLLWTGLELYVAEKRSTVWHCYSAKSAEGIELSRQHEKVYRCHLALAYPDLAYFFYFAQTKYHS